VAKIGFTRHYTKVSRTAFYHLRTLNQILFRTGKAVQKKF
jgi:hypothetical protein